MDKHNIMNYSIIIITVFYINKIIHFYIEVTDSQIV